MNLKTASGFAPVDEAGINAHAAMGFGDLCKGEYKITRNYRNLQRYFAFINATFDMQEHFDNKAHWRTWLQMRAGHYDSVVTPNGKALYIPRSIDFDKLDEIEFRQVFSECIDAALSVLNGVDENEIMRIVGFG